MEISNIWESPEYATSSTIREFIEKAIDEVYNKLAADPELENIPYTWNFFKSPWENISPSPEQTEQMKQIIDSSATTPRDLYNTLQIFLTTLLNPVERKSAMSRLVYEKNFTPTELTKDLFEYKPTMVDLMILNNFANYDWDFAEDPENDFYKLSMDLSGNLFEVLESTYDRYLSEQKSKLNPVNPNNQNYEFLSALRNGEVEQLKRASIVKLQFEIEGYLIFLPMIARAHMEIKTEKDNGYFLNRIPATNIPRFTGKETSKHSLDQIPGIKEIIDQMEAADRED